MGDTRAPRGVLRERSGLTVKTPNSATCGGLVHFHLERYGRATSDFRDAIARAPTLVKACTCLGSTYAMAAEYDLAVECYEEAIRIDPGYAEAQAGLEAVRAFLGSSSGEVKDLGPPSE